MQNVKMDDIGGFDLMIELTMTMLGCLSVWRLSPTNFRVISSFLVSFFATNRIAVVVQVVLTLTTTTTVMMMVMFSISITVLLF